MKSLIVIALLTVAATAHSQQTKTTPKSGCAGDATECGGKPAAPATNIYGSTKAPSNIYGNTTPPAQPRNVEATISPRSTPAPNPRPAAPAPKPPTAAAPRAASSSTTKPKS